MDNGETILGDPIATPRFHATPDGRLLVVYYVSDGAGLSENRLIELLPDGSTSDSVALPLEHPLTQFFTASPRAGCAQSWTLDMLGHRRGGWQPTEGTDGREWDAVISYARVRLDGQDRGSTRHE